ncbi:hypothetical protein RRG08_059683 [Elysia crispata]|uniref:Uncharacterized protein n=1 Tax=Elysia crispata TaxID=231223 RepID=A0AAE1B599_9GAST|nr:hypothetical protein RRG08_059683 [Elysia crispata]
MAGRIDRHQEIDSTPGPQYCNFGHSTQQMRSRSHLFLSPHNSEGLSIGVHVAGSKLQSAELAEEQISHHLIDSGVSNSSKTQRQDSGYFDMAADYTVDIEREEEMFVEPNKINAFSNIEQETASEQRWRYGDIPEVMFSLDGKVHRAAEEGDICHESRDFEEGLRVPASEYVLEEEDSKSQENSSGSQPDQDPSCVMSQQTCSVSESGNDPYPGYSLQFLRALAMLAGSRLHLTSAKEENEETQKRVGTADRRESMSKYDNRSPGLLSMSNDSSNWTYDETEDIRVQMSRLWLVVKALSLAVLLLAVVMVILCYKVHSLQCPEMAVAGSDPVASSYQTNQIASLHGTSGEKDSTDSASTTRVEYLDIAGQANHGPRPLDLRGYSPDKDELLWLDHEVTADQDSGLWSREVPRGNGARTRILQSRSLSELFHPPLELTSFLFPLKNQRDDGFGGDNANDGDDDNDDENVDEKDDEDNEAEDFHVDKDGDGGGDNDDEDSNGNSGGESRTHTETVPDAVEIYPSGLSWIKNESLKNGSRFLAPAQMLTSSSEPVQEKLLSRGIRAARSAKNATSAKKGRKGKGRQGKRTGKKNWKNNKKGRCGKVSTRYSQEHFLEGCYHRFEGSSYRRCLSSLLGPLFTRTGGRMTRGLTITSETYEGNFDNFFVMHTNFTVQCITVKRWPQQPKVCRDKLVRIQDANTPLGFFKPAKSNEKTKWKQLAKFDMKKGQFQVKKPGVYFVQAHLYYEDPSKTHWVAIFHNRQAVLACPPGGFRSSTNAKGKDNQRVCQTSGLIHLFSNSTLEIRTMEPRMEVALKAEKMATFKMIRLRPA